MRWATLLTVAMLACTNTAGTDSESDTDVETDTDTLQPWTQPEGGRIVLEMFDAVKVPTNYRPASKKGRPAVLMMACTPPGQPEYPWSPTLLDGVESRDWTLMVPDMRGCGESEGEWKPLLGPTGISDIRTFTTKLVQDGYGSVAVVTGVYIDGAVIAYTSRADAGEEEVRPEALVLMTSEGSATEDLATLATLDVRPILFQFLTPNRRWPLIKKREDPGTWEFIEYDGNLLDKGLFVQNPQAADDMLEFLDRALPK